MSDLVERLTPRQWITEAHKRITELEGEIASLEKERDVLRRQREQAFENASKWAVERGQMQGERDTATRALRELFAFVWDHVRTGSQVDSFDAQHKLAELGLIRLEPVRTADEEREWGETELWYPTVLVETEEPVT